MLLSRCFSKLKPDGIILLRDANKDLRGKHLITRYTELFSTSFKFNKAREKLDFFSADEIYATAEKYKMAAESINSNDRNSNIVYLLSHVEKNLLLP